MGTRKARAVAERSAHGHWYYHAAPRLENGVTEQKEIIVCGHGACTGGWYFDDFLKYASASGYHTYAKDIMGHGRSPKLASIGSASVGDYAEDNRDFIENVVEKTHPGSPIALVGHSMGGLIAMKLAEKKQFSSLVLLAPAPPHGIEYEEGEGLRVSMLEKFEIVRKAMLTLPHKPSKEVVASSLPHLLGKPKELDRVYGKFVAESLVAGEEIYFGLVAVDPKKIRCPKKVIVGEFDRVIDPKVAHQVAEFLGTKAIVKKGRGHMLVGEPGWKEVASDIIDFVKTAAKHK